MARTGRGYSLRVWMESNWKETGVLAVDLGNVGRDEIIDLD